MELFGSPNHRVYLKLPTRIEYLASQIPLAYHYSPLHIITSCTLLPFYSPFLDKNKFDLVLKSMIFENTFGRRAQLNSGWNANIIPEAKHMRYCVRCVKEDRQEGEMYFRRSHQIPGVSVCWKHAQPLVDSDIEINLLRKYITAEQSIGSINILHSESLGENHENLPYELQLAQDAHWLLGQANLQAGPSQLSVKYQTVKCALFS